MKDVMTKDETLKMALDFLMTRRMGAEAVIEALNEALAQPVQEPVAWMCSAFDGEPCEQTYHDECENPIPLYTTPPQRPWVGLTDEEVSELSLSRRYLVREVEARLKELNHG